MSLERHHEDMQSIGVDRLPKPGDLGVGGNSVRLEKTSDRGRELDHPGKDWKISPRL